MNEKHPEYYVIKETARRTGLTVSTVIDLYDHGWAFVQKVGHPDIWERQSFQTQSRKDKK